MLVEHFIGTIGKMSNTVKDHGNVVDISKGLKDILARMEGAVDGFTKDSVREIGKTCDSLLDVIKAAK
jgi:hypothetical protein